MRASSTTPALYLDPPSHHFLNDRLFDAETNPYTGENILAPYIALRDHFVSRGVSVHTADRLLADPDAPSGIYVSFGRTEDIKRLVRRKDVVLSAFFALECPIVEPRLYESLPELAPHFRRILSWSDAPSLERFTGTPIVVEHFSWPQSFDRVHDGLWDNRDRKFLVMINSNKLPRLYWQELYTQRLAAVAFFHQFGEIDLYGPNWGRMPNRVGRTWVPTTAFRIQQQLWKVKQRIRPNPLYRAAAQAHRGRTRSKARTLGSYRFAICFENMVLKGWMTEKIFDCFYAGTVPVYWGAPDVLDWVPADCFIDMRQFSGFAELRDHLHSLTTADVDNYREAARAYVASPRFDPFRKGAFVDLFRRIFHEDTGISA
jgi:hypothetical protein